MSISIEPTTGPSLEVAVRLWSDAVGIDPARLPAPEVLRDCVRRVGNPCRPPADPDRVTAWERRHGFRLPKALRAWILLSDGFYIGGPMIHPLSAIGPMVPFARVPGLLEQPESWFELGNPAETETICIDLACQWPGGDRPLFTSGDDEGGTRPRVIAPSFAIWFLRLLNEGGRQFWFDPEFPVLGEPWLVHRQLTAPPPLPVRLRRWVDRIQPLLARGEREHEITMALGLSRSDVETLVRHLQHVSNPGSPTR